MTIQEIHTRLIQEFGESIIVNLNSEAVDPWIEVDSASIEKVCRFLKEHSACQFEMLSDLTGVDYLETNPKLVAKFPYEPHIEVVYHLQSLSLKQRLKLKVKLPRWKDQTPGQLPEVPTVSTVWPIANWHEREAYDLIGIHFIGHPNLTRILTDDDWVGHPLRKDYDFPLEYHGIRAR
ncbi:NADH-quinone oxidoreductase subunit C [Planctomicrobium sp. SH668]|uniref:NADH-quinone oxidoreductase subunit C n=1 Tax=Planctomicrobium sp. SH668 TaxID=3448126 RepID=UPI003F5B5DD2